MKKKKQPRFRMMHGHQGKDLSPIEFYLLATQTMKANMRDWVNSHNSPHIAEIYKLERQQNNPLWAYQSVIARNATHAHGSYLREVANSDIAELSDYWDSLTVEQQKQEAISMWARLKWVNSAYGNLFDTFRAFDCEYLNKPNADHLTHKEGLLNTIDELSLSPHTWGAFSIMGHQGAGWHNPHSIGGGAIRDAQRHQDTTPPVRRSKISDDDLIVRIEAFKAKHGVRRGLNNHLKNQFKVSENAIINRLRGFCTDNPNHNLTFFINNK